MSELSLCQIDFLIKTLREEPALENTFNLYEKELFSKLEIISVGQKKLLHYLMIKNYKDKLIDVLDQLGIERK